MTGGGDGDTQCGYPNAEEILAALALRGLSAADMGEMTIGMCINFVYAYDRAYARSQGKDVSDPEEQYRKLKAASAVVEERYKLGEISRERYEEFMTPIWEYEAL